VEAQLAGSLLKSLIQTAYDNEVMETGSFQDKLKELLRVECDKLCRERLLHPLEAFDSEGEYFAQSPLHDVQERVVEQISLLWELMDVDTREKVQARVSDGLNPLTPRYVTEDGDPFDDIPEGYYEMDGPSDPGYNSGGSSLSSYMGNDE
jgi:hypothetical protein